MLMYSRSKVLRGMPPDVGSYVTQHASASQLAAASAVLFAGMRILLDRTKLATTTLQAGSGGPGSGYDPFAEGPPAFPEGPARPDAGGGYDPFAAPPVPGGYDPFAALPASPTGQRRPLYQSFDGAGEAPLQQPPAPQPQPYTAPGDVAAPAGYDPFAEPPREVGLAPVALLPLHHAAAGGGRERRHKEPVRLARPDWARSDGQTPMYRQRLPPAQPLQHQQGRVQQSQPMQSPQQQQRPPPLGRMQRAQVGATHPPSMASPNGVIGEPVPQYGHVGMLRGPAHGAEHQQQHENPGVLGEAPPHAEHRWVQTQPPSQHAGLNGAPPVSQHGWPKLRQLRHYATGHDPSPWGHQLPPQQQQHHEQHLQPGVPAWGVPPPARGPSDGLHAPPQEPPPYGGQYSYSGGWR